MDKNSSFSQLAYPFSKFFRFMYRETEEDNRIEETVKLIFYTLISTDSQYSNSIQSTYEKKLISLFFYVSECIHKLSKKSAPYVNLPHSTVIFPYL